MDMARIAQTRSRLRNGQDWLTRTWLELEGQDVWPEARERLFWKSYEAWDELEREARNAGQISGCVIGQDGCNPDAPIQCGFCAGADEISQSDSSDEQSDGPSDDRSPSRQAALFTISGGGH